MTVDLTDPSSIVAWYRVNPERHAAVLRWMLRSDLYARFRPAIDAAREMLREGMAA